MSLQIGKSLDRKLLAIVLILLGIVVLFYIRQIDSGGEAPKLVETLKQPFGPGPEENISHEEPHLGNVSNGTTENKTSNNVTDSGAGGTLGGGGSTMCGSAETQDERDWCLRGEAIERADPSICEMIEDSYYRDSCVIEVAIKLVDPALCKTVRHDYYRDSCYRYIALETENPIYCDEMQDADRRVWCYKALEE